MKKLWGKIGRLQLHINMYQAECLRLTEEETIEFTCHADTRTLKHYKGRITPVRDNLFIPD